MKLSIIAEEVIVTKFYTFKNKNYEVNKIIRFKDIITDSWIEIVEYSPLYEIDDYKGTFARTLDNFLEKFKQTV